MLILDFNKDTHRVSENWPLIFKTPPPPEEVFLLETYSIRQGGTPVVSAVRVCVFHPQSNDRYRVLTELAHHFTYRGSSHQRKSAA